MAQNNFYVGYSSFEELLKLTIFRPRMFLSRSVVTTPAQFNSDWVDWFVTAAVIDENICHYWRLTLGGYNTIKGEALFQDKEYEEKCSSRCGQIEKMMTAIAKENGYIVTRGLISFPKDLVILKGQTNLLKFDEKQNLFTRKEAAQQPEEANV